MRTCAGRIIAGSLSVLLVSLTCTLSFSPGEVATQVAGTLAAAQTATALASVLQAAPTSTYTPTPAPIDSSTPVPTPQNPLVIVSTLCWVGPGPAYEVVSSIKAGTRVELLGKGSISGWWIVRNPIYHDPCWIREGDLQIEPGFDLSKLKIFYPPPTPTPTYTPSPTPTP